MSHRKPRTKLLSHLWGCGFSLADAVQLMRDNGFGIRPAVVVRYYRAFDFQLERDLEGCHESQTPFM